MEGNLTKGPILKTLTKLAVPIMASSFLGTLYNITDMAWIGLLGSKAVAGVGVGGMFTWFSQGLASMSRMGGQVQVAQCIGRGDKEEAHKYAQTAVQLATLMGLLFAAVMLLFLHPLVGFFQLQDPEALQAALSYTKIACGLIVFSFLTLTLTGIYTAQGDSKTPFIANFIGLVTNMILDPLLILGLGPVNKFGVNGAAIATVSAQAIVMTILILGIIRQKKQNVLNLIKYHVEKNENAFRNEAVSIAKYFDAIGDYQLAEYIMSLIAESNLYVPQASDFESEFLKQIDIREMQPLNLPVVISNDIKGIINAVNHNIGINKFLLEGLPGSGKTEAAKHIARLLGRTLYCVDFEHLIDSKLGQTNKNIASVFAEINMIPYSNKVVILFDEIDVIALDRVNRNDVREMGRVTSTILREFDRLTDLNKEIVIIATTNLYSNFDKALIRRFDAVINFNRYSKEDLLEVAEYYFVSFIKNFKGIPKDTRLFKKILKVSSDLPYPGELKNIIKTSLAFSDANIEYDYLRRLYNYLIGNLEETDIEELHAQGFTVREIEKLKGESKSTVSRKLSKGEEINE